MTSIERTAYSYISASKIIAQKTLEKCYVLTQRELEYIDTYICGNKLRGAFAVQLKVFQNLGCFVDMEEIPASIVGFIRKQLNLPHNLKLSYDHLKTLSRHRERIRDHLQIKPWNTQKGESAQRVALRAAYSASQTMNNPADIINVVIEELVSKHFELPAFNTLDRLVRHARARVNQDIFQRVFQQLQADQLLEKLDHLLIVAKEESYSDYQKLKDPPQAPTITQFRAYLGYYHWLMSFGSLEHYLRGITKVKLKQFAEEAKSLDVDNLKDLAINKKYMMITSLLYRAQQVAKDAWGIFVCKTIFTTHKQAKRKLDILKEKLTEQTQGLAKLMLSIVEDYKETPHQDKAFSLRFKQKIDDQGGLDEIEALCQKLILYNSKNHIPFLWEQFKTKRSAVFGFLSALELRSSTRHKDILHVLNFIANHQQRRSDHLVLDEQINLGFISEKWKSHVFVGKPEDKIVSRRYLELCAFSYLVNELRSGDLFIAGADAFSDYRHHLLSLEECDLLIEDYLQELGFPKTAEEFVTFLRNDFVINIKKVDQLYPKLTDFFIGEDDVPVIKKTATLKPTKHTEKLVEKIHNNMPERSLLDVLCLTHHLTGWAYEFGHISGANSRLDHPEERYILNVFCQGTGMGATQGAKHIKNTNISPHMLSWINRRHVTTKQLDKAKDKLINYSQLFLLTTAWGDGKRCAADGTLRNIYEDNLVAESHIRYQLKGGVAYNHIADTYVALFSTFIPCGVWEAVEIIEALLKNESQIRPEILHADTQGQSTVVFALCYLLGIKLMPRIRNWKDLNFYRPSKERYKNIDALFKDEIDWELIRMHWKDLLQVVLSIKQGKISTSFLLRKLTTYNRKNRLYPAFQELGRVIRTQFLLEYISNIRLREIITASTNKVEAYNALSDWILFGSKVIVASNDPDEMEKAVKYNALIANCIVLHNIIDYSYSIHQLQQEGYDIVKEDVARISPYLTDHLKRFGDYVLDMKTLPENIDMIKNARLF
jgi:TnpA family transposase